MAAATTRCGATPRRGGGAVRHRRRRPMCRWCSRRARPISSTGAHEYVVLAGVTTKVKVAHVRLCHSRMFFVRAYPRESQEMVFDAHDRAFRLFQGACRRGIYDNMKTAVQTVLIGKVRAFNRRFVQMCGHYLVEPTACTPGAGWEKGQVENQVGIIRGRFFTPRLRFKTYDELNAWLLDQCVAYARRHPHPGVQGQDCLAGVRGRASVPGRLSRAVRRLPRGPGVGVEDLPGALRQQQVQRGGARRRPSGRGPCLRRSHRHPPGRRDRRRACPALRPRPDRL